MSITRNKPGALFWIIGILALIWNLMGVSAYLFQMYATPEIIEALPPEQQAEFMVEHPSWLTALFAIAVFGGALACILLLARKKVAYYFFILSGVCAIIQQVYLLMNVEVNSFVMPIMVIVVCIFLIFYAKRAITKGYLS